MTPERMAQAEAKARRDSEIVERDGADEVLLERLHRVDEDNEIIALRLGASQVGALVLCAEGMEPGDPAISPEQNLHRQSAFLNGFQMGHDYCARYGPLQEEHDA